ncbi:MAG: Arylmalonate decarboxylase [Anaerolineales bacterium]|nr:Arylmalonate decarboxylase [Anaerolineales bacterium]
MSWRARLGIIYPADGALDDEYWKLVPPGVTVHITRIEVPHEDQTIELLEAQATSPDIEKAAGDLTIIRLDAVAYACTSGSFLLGAGSDLDIIQRMEAAASGVPCTTTTTAAVRALKALGAKKLAVVTPYPDEINARLEAFLADSGFQVVALEGLGLYHGIWGQPAGAAYRLATEADVPEAEAMFISCTNFRTLEVLDALEQDLGKPVVSANQATVWDLLRLAGIRPNLERLGMLYRIEPTE